MQLFESPVQEQAPELHIAHIGPKEAEYILDNCSFQGQRSTVQTNVDKLARTMRLGEWRPYSDIEFVQLEDGSRILTNGYHRLLAVIASRTKQTFHAKVVYGNGQTVRDRYALHDRGAIRSMDNVYKTQGRFSFSAPVLRKLRGAAGVIAAGFGPKSNRTRTDMEYVRLMDAMANDFDNYWTIVSKLNDRSLLYRNLRSIHVVAIGMVTFASEPFYAKEFWSKVMSGIMLAPEDPRYHLREYLSRFSQRNETAALRRTAIEIAKVTAYAWSAYCEEKELNRLTVPFAPDRPIHGTDFSVGSGNTPEWIESIMKP